MQPAPLILYAEDDADHAELVMRGLAKSAHPARVVHLTDGEAAIDYLDRAGRGDAACERPHLVLLDLRLPKRDGIEVLARIKSSDRTVGIPVVVLTTSSSERDIHRAYEHHANSYVVKPTAFATLSKFLDDLSTYWTSWNVADRPR